MKSNKNRYRLVVSFDGGNYSRVETYKDMDEPEALENLVEALDVPLDAHGEAYCPTEEDVAKALGRGVKPSDGLCRAETKRQRAAYDAFTKLMTFVATGGEGECRVSVPDPNVPGAATEFVVSSES